MDESIAKAHQEIATRNSQNAVKSVDQLRAEMVDAFNAQSRAMQQMHAQLTDLQQKYNLLLTKNFHGGSTSE
jgi:hypothetical protein